MGAGLLFWAVFGIAVGIAACDFAPPAKRDDGAPDELRDLPFHDDRGDD
jgi:hypothetical protein